MSLVLCHSQEWLSFPKLYGLKAGGNSIAMKVVDVYSRAARLKLTSTDMVSTTQGSNQNVAWIQTLDKEILTLEKSICT